MAGVAIVLFLLVQIRRCQGAATDAVVEVPHIIQVPSMPTVAFPTSPKTPMPTTPAPVSQPPPTPPPPASTAAPVRTGHPVPMATGARTPSPPTTPAVLPPPPAVPPPANPTIATTAPATARGPPTPATPVPPAPVEPPAAVTPPNVPPPVVTPPEVPPPPVAPPPPVTPAPGQPTAATQAPPAQPVSRLRITNGCAAEPIWIAHMAAAGVGPDGQNVKLAPLQSFDFTTFTGLTGTRYWPKMRCDEQGNRCQIGESGGPQEVCHETAGCAPPVDTKFEASFGAFEDWVDISLVDGFTLPFKFEMEGNCTAGFGNKDVTTNVIDCSKLSFDQCPRAEDMGTVATNVDLQVLHPDTQQAVGCYSPCSKLTLSQWGNADATGAPPSDPRIAPYCCPTPPETPHECRAGPIPNTSFVQAVHTMCPGVYGFSYDDGMGLLKCSSQTRYQVTFYCPAAATPAAGVAFGAGVPQPPAVPAPTAPAGDRQAAFLAFVRKFEKMHVHKEQSQSWVRGVDWKLSALVAAVATGVAGLLANHAWRRRSGLGSSIVYAELTKSEGPAGAGELRAILSARQPETA